MRVVCPYKPFVPESQAHQRLGPFDWIGALTMALDSATRATKQQAFALTDMGTTLSVPTIHVPTLHARLMLWIVEVCLRYLESDRFDADTMMMSPDTLMFSQGPVLDADLAVIARFSAKHVAREKTILNGAQWWRHSAKLALIAFYRSALAIAERLPEDRIVWGGDTDPLIDLLSPVMRGTHRRAGLTVEFRDASRTMESLRSIDIGRMNQGLAPLPPTVPLVDFKYLRKQSMRRYYRATIGKVSA